jgi:hypothetical protein
MEGITPMASAISQSNNNIWPSRGATLKEACRLIMGQTFCLTIQQASEWLSSDPEMPPRAKLTMLHALHRPFFEKLSIDSYRVVGRRGSPTSAVSPIPPSAWPDLHIQDWPLFRIAEPDGTIWYDIRVRRDDQIAATTETVGTAPAPRRLNTARWVAREVERRRASGIPIAVSKSQFARELRKEMVRAEAAGEVDKAVTKRTLENVLRIEGLWPIQATRN